MEYSAVYGIDYTRGAAFVTNGTPAAGRFCALHFTSNSQINAVTVHNWTGVTLVGHQFDAGTIIYGVFTYIELQSGHCIAYRL